MYYIESEDTNKDFYHLTKMVVARLEKRDEIISEINKEVRKMGLKNITLLDWISIFTKANYPLHIVFYGKDGTSYIFYEGKVRHIRKGDKEIMDEKTLKHFMEKMEDQSSLFEIKDDEDDVVEETDEEVEEDYQNLKKGNMVWGVKERRQVKKEEQKVRKKQLKDEKDNAIKEKIRKYTQDLEDLKKSITLKKNNVHVIKNFLKKGVYKSTEQIEARIEKFEELIKQIEEAKIKQEEVKKKLENLKKKKD